MKEVVEILLRYLCLKDLNHHDILIVLLWRHYDVSFFLILVVSTIIILRGLLNVAIFESLDLSFLILVLSIFVFILFLIVFFVLIPDTADIPSVHALFQLLIIVVLHLISFIVILFLILKLVLIILLIVFLALAALSIAAFACTYRSVAAHFLI